MSQADLLTALPDAQKKHLDPKSPMPMRMMAAKGLVPVPPREMVIILCGLSLDGDTNLADAAKASLDKLPDKVLGPALDKDLPEAAFALLVPALRGKDDLLEKAVLNRRVPDHALATIAGDCSERIVEILSQNQERCMRSAPLVDAIRKNPALLKSSSDRLFDFLVRAGIIYDGMPEYGDALERLNPTEMAHAADKIELPPEVHALFEDNAESEVRAEEAASALDLHGEDEAKKRVPMLKLVTTLNVAQKIALALKGNREARTILLRDTNRVVSAAAIRSPRVTEQEVLACAKSRSVSDEVVRIIAASKDMIKSYGVKMALVQNPKTPMPTAMRFLSLLREADVKSISKSKNVPQAIANQARRLLAQKQEK
jgi:hypothetical protein